MKNIGIKRSTFVRLMVAGALSAPLATRRAIAAAGAPRKLVLIAGKASHGPGLHEFRAGNILLEKRMRGVPGLRVELHEQGWVRDEATLADADAVVIFCDGGKNHPAIQDGRIALLEKLVQRGAGIGMMHFGVEVPAERAERSSGAGSGDTTSTSFPATRSGTRPSSASPTTPSPAECNPSPSTTNGISTCASPRASTPPGRRPSRE